MKSQANRRRHPRLDIDLPAVIEYQGHPYESCHMLNFSRGGAYLQCHDKALSASLPAGYFAEYERPEALLSLPSESLRARVSLVYFYNDGLGIAFLDAAGTRLFETIHARRLKQEGRQKREAAGPAVDVAAFRELLDRLWQLAKGFLEAALPSFFTLVQRDLQQMIRESGDPKENSVLFYALNSLEQDRAELIQRFIDQSAAGFAQSLGGQPTARVEAVDESSELSLVEKQEIDTWILLNDVARRAEAEVSRILARLEIALSHLCQGNIHNELNPLAPISLLTTLKSLLDEYELDIKSVQVILRAFRKSLLNDLGFLYTDLLQLLQQSGFGEMEQAPQSRWTIVKASEPGRYSGSSIGHLTALTKRYSSAGHEAGSVAISENEREDISATLESLSSQQGASLHQQIERLLAQQGGPPVRLSPEARAAIGAGEELVASLGKDPLITDELRTLLGSLKFLIIEAVLQNSSLLDSPGHPVRQLLDTIESLKPYINTGPHASLIRDRESQRLTAITEAVLAGRIEHLDQVTHEIQTLLVEQRERFEKNRKLTISRCLKNEKLRQAQISTYEALAKLLMNRHVPAAVDKLLSFGWVNLMVQSAVLEGPQGKSWHRYLEVVEFIANLFAEELSAPRQTEEQRRALMSTIRTGFDAYPVYPEGARRFEDFLRGVLTDGVPGNSDLATRRIAVDERYLQTYFREMRRPWQQIESETETVEPGWRDTIERIALDAWLVERTEANGLRVLSLAWKNPRTQRYLLVDGDGFKALDEELSELATRFAARDITLMERPAQPVVERTIENILSRSYDGFKQESSIDSLTGLSNRRTFETELRRRLNEKRIDELPHALLLIDLDKFQVVNDLCGFEGGDRLLQTVTDILVNYLPEGGFVARIGDDEFCLLLQDHDIERGYLTAENLRSAIDDYPFEWKGRLIPSSASVGIVQPDSSEQTPGELMRAALAACNLAKEGGGNCTRIYLASDSAYRDHQQLVQSLPTIKEALAKGQMELFVQPIVPLFEERGLSLHHEVLLRIRNGAGELESPQAFVRAAEQYDLMRAVDHWVVNAFFEMVEPFAERLPAGQSFAINLSGKSVADSEFRGFLKKRIYESRLSASHLGFEITETALVGDISDTACFIEEIQELGCTFSLDDFGSGYASFTYLKDFPVDFVKIDGVFVREILDKPADLAMINTITEIAHFMDRRVIAEYVVDGQIELALRGIGVDYGQGYHFDKPRPLQEVLAEIVEGTVAGTLQDS